MVWAVDGAGTETVDRARWLRDINGDGRNDVIVAIASNGPAFADALWFLSGADGSLLRRRTDIFPSFFYMPASAGDVNGDGVGDYAITIDGPSRGSAEVNLVEVCSGRDDAVLWQVQGPWNDAFGKSLLGDLDVDGDGRSDLVLTAPTGPLHARVSAYSNAGTPLWVVGDGPGYALAFRRHPLQLGKVGDVDGDGCDDVAVGASQQGLAAAAVLSGKDGRILAFGLGDPGDQLGEINDGSGDMDGDGTPDFGAGQLGLSSIGGVRVWSGRTNQPLWTWRTPRQPNQLGAGILSKGLDVDRSRTRHPRSRCTVNGSCSARMDAVAPPTRCAGRTEASIRRTDTTPYRRSHRRADRSARPTASSAGPACAGCRRSARPRTQRRR